MCLFMCVFVYVCVCVLVCVVDCWFVVMVCVVFVCGVW
jgi:hypothetical protein